MSEAEALRSQAQQLKPDDLVAICTRKSLELYVCLLAVLKAGGCYVPVRQYVTCRTPRVHLIAAAHLSLSAFLQLDPSYPLERLEYMINDTGASILLSHTDLLEKMKVCRKVEIACLPARVCVNKSCGCLLGTRGHLVLRGSRLGPT
jgi:non-ribosomal peptide synthetase component F